MGEREQILAQVARLVAGDSTAKSDPPVFRGRLFDEGLAFVNFPDGLGGRGLSPSLQSDIDRVLAETGVPSAFMANPIGVGMGAPTVVGHGSRELCERVLRPLYTGEEIWCQLFSEPGAGSDVASLATRAVRDGQEWRVTGQKVWTTLAHKARWGMLLARTNPDVPKHRGMTYFVLDMTAPGVEVRPLRQITGEAEFNEVYLTDAIIPDQYRLGEVGQGWSVALTTLMNERASIGGVVLPRDGGAIAMALALFRDRDYEDPILADALADLWIRSEVLRLTTKRAGALREAGNPGPEGSTVKLASAELNQEIYAFCMELLGEDGIVYEDYDMRSAESAMVMGREEQRSVVRAYLRARANSIEGGTSEIMRNILGERVLGLPGDPRVDKDLPWAEIRRN